jgi:hypothetical protein
MIEWTVGLKTGTEPQSGCTIDGKLTGNVLDARVALSLRKNHPACFLLREQREDDDGNEPEHVVFLSEGASRLSALRPLVPMEQLCVFVCGSHITK